jgi:tetratricopeptide (TPR) repeat protein
MSSVGLNGRSVRSGFSFAAKNVFECRNGLAGAGAFILKFAAMLRVVPGSVGRCSLLVAGIVTLCGLAPAQTPEQSHQIRFENPAVTLARSERELTEKIAANPSDVESFRQRGLIRLQQTRLAEALSDLETAVRLAPQNSQTHTDLGTGLFDSGKPQEAIGEARKSISLDDHNFAAEALLGRLLLVSGGDPHEAIEHMSHSLDIDADQPDLRFDLINALRSIKDYTAAGVQVRILGVSLPPGDARREYAQASVDLDLAHPDAAILHLRRALKVNPDFAPAQQDLAAALIQSGRWQEASEILGPLVQRDPHSAQLAYMDALVLENTHHAAAAEAEANRAIALNPNLGEAYVVLGIAQAFQERHAAALDSLERGAALQPGRFDAQFYLGRERYAVNDAAGAAQALERAVQLRPQDPEARFLLGTALESAGNKDSAIEEFQQLIQLRPNDPRGHIGLGSILLRYGQDDQALPELMKARSLDPENFETTMDIGKILARQGKSEESIPYLRDAARQAPSSPEAHYQLALGLKRVGRNEEAEREFAEVDHLNRARRGVSMARPN